MAERLEPMMLDELLQLPVSVDLRTAARALGITANKAYELAGKGQFPCPLRRDGRNWRVSRASIFRELDLDPAMAA